MVPNISLKTKAGMAASKVESGCAKIHVPGPSPKDSDSGGPEEGLRSALLVSP